MLKEVSTTEVPASPLSASLPQKPETAQINIAPEARAAEIFETLKAHFEGGKLIRTFNPQNKNEEAVKMCYELKEIEKTETETIVIVYNVVTIVGIFRRVKHLKNLNSNNAFISMDSTRV